jgi:2-oxoglutarate dehydrogenase E2 component (dihydrolipoamide succinyltransferase)
LRPGEELIKHSRMRQAIARTTVQSAFTAPHVTTLWDVDMTTVLAHRKAQKKDFEKAGVNLTVTAYLIGAAIAGLKTVPAANATWTDEGVIIKRYYNVGMAAALPMDEYGMGGLIVPVIKNAGDLNLMGLARAVNELTDKARKNQLRSEDLQDGTFTISNYGTSGSRFQTPVIVQPQVGILGTGAIEKRPVVVSNGSPLEANMGDYLTFKPMMTLGFSYDHRVLDGATADAFCAAVKQALENWK